MTTNRTTHAGHDHFNTKAERAACRARLTKLIAEVRAELHSGITR